MVISLLYLVFVGVVMVSNKQYPVGQYPDGFFCPKSNPNRTFIPIFSYSYRVFNIVHANLLEPQSS